MPSSRVGKLPNRPLVVVANKGKLTDDDASTIYKRIEAIASMHEGAIFRITDARKLEASLPNIIKLIKAASQAPDTSTDKRIQNVFVGDEEFAIVVREALTQDQFEHIEIPVFPTLEEAYDYINTQLSPGDQD
jgi:hypothetical protein